MTSQVTRYFPILIITVEYKNIKVQTFFNIEYNI